MNKQADKLKSGLVFLCDQHGKVTELIYDGLKIASDELQGKPWSTLVDEASQKKSANFMESIDSEGATVDWELNLQTDLGIETFSFAGINQGEKYMIIIAKTNREATQLVEEFTRIGNEQMNVLRTVIKENVKLRRLVEQDNTLYDDITNLNNELVTLQRAMVKKNTELEKLNQLKNRFLGMASHDLRNPLSNILNLTEFLEKDGDNFSGEQIEFITYIKELSAFMVNLVDELLDFAAIESGSIDLNIEPVDLIELIRNNIAINQVIAAKKSIEIEFLSNLKSYVLAIDKGKIEQVINNLVTNAIKYSQPDTEIIVKVAKDETHIITSVADMGQGIAEDEMDLLFRPFQKTSSKTTSGEKSTGLGLYIVQKVIDAHKGKIWVESTLGEGSVFYFTLPGIQ